MLVKCPVVRKGKVRVRRTTEPGRTQAAWITIAVEYKGLEVGCAWSIEKQRFQ